LGFVQAGLDKQQCTSVIGGFLFGLEKHLFPACTKPCPHSVGTAIIAQRIQLFHKLGSKKMSVTVIGLYQKQK
jgi:hypothetical protein